MTGSASASLHVSHEYEETRTDATFRANDVFTERLRTSARLKWQLRCKRGFDVVAAAVLLTLTFPLVLVGAIATMVTSPGNPFFSGQRWGLAGTLFACYKLRTMHSDPEGILSKLGLSAHAEDGRLLVFDRDPRISALGAFLRKTSIDELPQLVNVVLGDMSLVGPRPLATYMLQDYPSIRNARGCVRPGITGLWQVRRRMKNASIFDMIRDDEEYVATWTFASDLRILVRTIPRLLEP